MPVHGASNPAAGEDVIDLLGRLVRAESPDPPGDEREVAAVVASTLAQHGVEHVVDEFRPGRINIVARVAGRRPDGALVFSSHMDTVPIGAAAWQRAPFSGEIDAGRLHGRGASDMKSALAAMVALAVELHAGPPPGRDILFAFSAGESSSCLGAQRMVETGALRNAGGFVVGEPSSMNLIVAEMGALWLRLRARTRGGHVSGEGSDNAITRLMRAMARLEGTQLPSLNHPLCRPTTMNIGTIRGGTAVNVIPDACDAEIDIRFPPGVDAQRLLAAVRAAAADEVECEVVDLKQPVETAPQSHLARLAASACEAETGMAPQTLGVAYFSDATIFCSHAPAPFVIVGPGELGLSGATDEWVALERVHQAVRVYRHMAMHWEPDHA